MASIASSAPAVGVINPDTMPLYWYALTTICRDSPRRSANGTITGMLIIGAVRFMSIWFGVQLPVFALEGDE